MHLHRKLISLGFLALLGAVMPLQILIELRAGERPGVLDLSESWSTAPERQDFEAELRRRSFLRRLTQPTYRSAMLALFGEGNSEARVGRGGWLYLDDDVKLVHGRPFGTATLEAAWSALVETRDELRSRGIELVVAPIPNKASEVPGFLAEGVEGPLANPGRERFLAGCWERGLSIVSPGWDGVPRSEYLPRDTHWTPHSVEAFAAALAERIRMTLGEPDAERRLETILRPGIRRGAGDLVHVLGLREGDEPFEPMEVEIRAVERSAGPGHGPRGAASKARVLLLGDSFSGIYSDAAYGFGEGAGLAEHLGHRLGEAVDAIAVAGGGAEGSRRAWARRLASGKPLAEPLGEPLAKDGAEVASEVGSRTLPRVVVWQFSMRDLAKDPSAWPSVPLFGNPDVEGAGRDGGTGNRPRGLTIRGEVTAVSTVPEEFDYDFCLAMHRVDVTEILDGTFEGMDPASIPESVVVAGEALVDREPTDWSRLGIGDRRVFVLEPVELHHDLERTAAIDTVGAFGDIWFPVEMRHAR